MYQSGNNYSLIFKYNEPYDHFCDLDYDYNDRYKLVCDFSLNFLCLYIDIDNSECVLSNQFIEFLETQVVKF